MRSLFAKWATPCWRRHAIRSRGTKDERGEAAYLFGVSISSAKRVTLVWFLSSSTEGKDNRGESINAIVLLYRSNLSYGVETHPWHVRANGLSKPPEKLQLLLLTEHQFASGHTLELENEFRLGTIQL